MRRISAPDDRVLAPQGRYRSTQSVALYWGHAILRSCHADHYFTSSSHKHTYDHHHHHHKGTAQQEAVIFVPLSQAVLPQHLSGWSEKYHEAPVMAADLWLENRTREFPNARTF